MCSLFRKQFRIESSRLAGHDYSSPGKYFITICVKKQNPFFGKIAKGKMILNDIGIIANKFWLEIPHHYQNIKLDEYIIMPDHIHGIIIINPNPSVETPKLGVSTESGDDSGDETPKLGVSTSMQSSQNYVPGKNPNWKSNSIGSIINQYKRICTLNIQIMDRDFKWHPRFHDMIIRNNKKLNCIRKYIKNNPSK